MAPTRSPSTTSFPTASPTIAPTPSPVVPFDCFLHFNTFFENGNLTDENWSFGPCSQLGANFGGVLEDLSPSFFLVQPAAGGCGFYIGQSLQIIKENGTSSGDDPLNAIEIWISTSDDHFNEPARLYVGETTEAVFDATAINDALSFNLNDFDFPGSTPGSYNTITCQVPISGTNFTVV
jgi:hypothetical protein